MAFEGKRFYCIWIFVRFDIERVPGHSCSLEGASKGGEDIEIEDDFKSK